MACELFVGNLNPSVRVRDLENLFGRYGKITRCDMKKNYAFIAIGDRLDGEEAIRKENNRRLLGSVMTVEWAKGTFRQKPGARRSVSPPTSYRRPRSPLPPPPRYPERVHRRSPIEERGRAPLRRDRSPLGRSAPRFRDEKFNSTVGRYRDRDTNDLSSAGYGGDRLSSRDGYADRSMPRVAHRGDHGSRDYGERRYSGGGGSRRF